MKPNPWSPVWRCAALLVLVSLLLTVSASAAGSKKKILYNFTGGNDGAYPYAGFVVGTGGILYSTTSGGGLDYCGYPCGVVFSFTPPQAGGSWTEAPVYSWEGGYPTGSTTGVVFDNKGNLYGTSLYVLYQLVPPQSAGSWTYNMVADTADGQLADPAVDAAGNLYYTYGDVYELSPGSNGTWTPTTIPVDAGVATMVIDKQGRFYGTTSTGGRAACGASGAEDCGSVFELVHQSDGTWNYDTIYQFYSNSTGYFPQAAGLALDAEGNLYGSAQLINSECAGGNGCAMTFKLSRPAVEGGAWTETPLHAFEGGKDGFWLNAALSVDSKGAVYGTSIQGGSGFCLSNGEEVGCGTVFQLKPPAEPGGQWTETLYSFQGGSDGLWPSGSLLIDEKAGAIYGTTPFGGAYNAGTIFDAVFP
jgi:hypothetical protein